MAAAYEGCKSPFQSRQRFIYLSLPVHPSAAPFFQLVCSGQARSTWLDSDGIWVVASFQSSLVCFTCSSCLTFWRDCETCWPLGTLEGLGCKGEAVKPSSSQMQPVILPLPGNGWGCIGNGWDWMFTLGNFPMLRPMVWCPCSCTFLQSQFIFFISGCYAFASGTYPFPGPVPCSLLAC